MKNRWLHWIIILLVQIVLVQLLVFVPEGVERFYSNGLYPIIAGFSRMILGWISFSVGDLTYFIVGIFLLKWLFKVMKGLKTKREIAVDVAFALNVFYFLFHLLWGFNYYRQPLFEKMNIQKEYSDADLMQFSLQMIEKTNAIQEAITKNPTQKVINTVSQEAIFEQSLLGYEKLAQRHSDFYFENPSMKKSLLSLPLSYMGFSGYLNPFSNEAQVNSLVPMINFPFTTCHEMAHQIGYASETEANFIGFLAVTHNDNLHFKYAGYSIALRYCLRSWEIRNPEITKQLWKKINPGVKQNFEDSTRHWQQYDTFIDDGFNYFYDHFLKANQQNDGTEGYSKFLNLLINYAKEQTLE